MYARMAAGIWRFARSPMPADVAGGLRQRLRDREEAWLSLLRRTVFGGEENPYREMFRLAGITWEQLAAAVRTDGLEVTLQSLYTAGVYLSHEELKGREPIVRGGQTIAASERSFDNPLVHGVLQTRSSGSRSKGTRTGQSVGYYQEVEAYYQLTIEEFALQGRPFVSLWPVLPSDSGLKSGLLFLRQGQTVSRWFATGGNQRTPWYYRALTLAMVAVARQSGKPVPWPQWLAPNDFQPVAAHLAELSRTGRPAVVSSYVSPAVRTAACALELGLRLDGTLFRVVGEALTAAKRAVIEKAGARVAPFYWITEVGPIGHSCAQMPAGNDVHLFADSVAVIQRRKVAPLTGSEVDALLFTTIAQTAPRVLINADTDDSGRVGPASCDCAFRRAGFTTTIRDIASVGKVTGHGITLFGTDVVRVLETVLPQRFGGSAGDFQLVEMEAANQTELLLRIRPGVAKSSPDSVKEGFLEAVSHCYGGSLAVRQWRHMEAIRVEVADPILTETGKILPLQLLKRE